MPIYEFICESCGNEFEKILSFSATHAPACPACLSEDVNRRMSRPAIHFKGSGWYITDSKSTNGKNGANKSDANDGEGKADSSPAEPSKSESSGESKSEPKNEPKSESVRSEASSQE